MNQQPILVKVQNLAMHSIKVVTQGKKECCLKEGGQKEHCILGIILFLDSSVFIFI